MADKFERLSFTKDWNNSSDFPTYEENEAQVRADMQALHDEVKTFINEKLIPGIENLAVPGTGDMLTDVFDPDGMMQDIFAYARAQAAGAVSAARTNTGSAIEEYNGTQVEKFDKVDARLATAENALKTTPGAITLLREYRTAGEYTVQLPAGTVAVYALAVGAGGGGAKGRTGSDNSLGGGGGAGGNALFIGPVLPENIKNFSVTVGKGGAGASDNWAGENGGASSVFGLVAAGGAGGGSSQGDVNPPGKQEPSLSGEALGGSGGEGAYWQSGGYPDVVLNPVGSKTGNAAGVVMPILMVAASAGGGGGGHGGAVTGSAGGICGFGSGGNGGTGGTKDNGNGGDGSQCCGGGGGGGSDWETGTGKGGNGGDGYVAIWIQRSGIDG